MTGAPAVRSNEPGATFGGNRLGEGLRVHPTIGRLIDARRDDRHPHHLFESGLDDRAHDDVGFFVDFLAHPARGFVHFIQRQILAAGDRNQNASGSFQ
jgi:hypothetical protein